MPSSDHLRMSLSPPDEVLLGDMLEWVRKTRRFIADVSEDGFLKDERAQSAVIRGLIVIAEIAGRVSEPTRVTLAELPWRELRGMRNRLVHDYLGVDIDEVWRTVTVDLPHLERLLESAAGRRLG